jgi:hypothetical protein
MHAPTEEERVQGFAALEAVCGPLAADVRDFLEECGYLQEALAGPEADNPRVLAKELRQDLDRFAADYAPPATTRRSAELVTDDLLGEADDDVRAAMARAASELLSVREFRARRLWRRTLTAEQAMAFLAISATDPSLAERARQPQRVDAVGVLSTLLAPNLFAEAFGDPDVCEPVWYPSPVGELLQVVVDLVRRFPWSTADATRFVLSGTTPNVRLARGIAKCSALEAAGRVVLVLDPSLTEAQVHSAYVRVQRRLQPTDAERKRRALASFLNTHDDISGRERFELWNDTQAPEWRFALEDNFRTAEAKAFRRVYGMRWKDRPQAETRGQTPPSPEGIEEVGGAEPSIDVDRRPGSR